MNAGDIFLRRDLSNDAPEKMVALDIVKRGLMVAPLLVGICAAGWGFKGMWSSSYAIALVLINFFIAAWMVGAAAKISLGLLMATTLFGYVLRLGLITIAILAVEHRSWVNLLPLGLTLVVTHLGLLAWETKYVSASLAFPGLKPKSPSNLTPPRSQHA